MVARLDPPSILRWWIDAAIVGLVIGVLVGVGLVRLAPMTGHETRIIAGPSMEPSLPIGSIVILEPVSAGDLRPGDIVTIRIAPGAAPFTHRVNRLLTLNGQPYVETKGDANAAPDPTAVPVSAVTGRVIVSIPWLGYLLALLTLPSGVMALFCLAGCLVLLALLLEPPDAAPVLALGRPRPAPTLESRIARHLSTTPRPPRRGQAGPRS